MVDWTHSNMSVPVEERVYDAGEDHVTFGRRWPRNAPNWSKIRAWWQIPPAVLQPGQTMTIQHGVQVITPGWANSGGFSSFYHVGRDYQLGEVRVSEASAGATSTTRPHVVPDGLGAKSGGEERLRYRAISEFIEVVFSYRWVPAGASAPAPAPAPATAAPKPTASSSPATTFDGSYRGVILNLMYKEALGVTFTVSGTRITMARDRLDGPGKGHSGTVQPNGEFMILFPNNIYRGRIVGRSLTGTWTMEKGLIVDKPRSGSIEASK